MLFYEIKIDYQRQTGENDPGKVKETYLVEGINCADVENRLMEEIKPLIFGEAEVPSCKKTQFFDLFPNPEGDRWYKARVEMITIEDNGKEKRKTVSILVQGNNIDAALATLKKQLTSLDCEIVSVTRSPILEVYRAV